MYCSYRQNYRNRAIKNIWKRSRKRNVKTGFRHSRRKTAEAAARDKSGWRQVLFG